MRGGGCASWGKKSARARSPPAERLAKQVRYPTPTILLTPKEVAHRLKLRPRSSSSAFRQVLAVQREYPSISIHFGTSDDDELKRTCLRRDEGPDSRCH